jgi:hypothetical protein
VKCSLQHEGSERNTSSLVRLHLARGADCDTNQMGRNATRALQIDLNSFGEKLQNERATLIIASLARPWIVSDCLTFALKESLGVALH